MSVLNNLECIKWSKDEFIVTESENIDQVNFIMKGYFKIGFNQGDMILT